MAHIDFLCLYLHMFRVQSVSQNSANSAVQFFCSKSFFFYLNNLADSVEPSIIKASGYDPLWIKSFIRSCASYGRREGHSVTLCSRIHQHC